ncbi:amidohydrolase family protein [Candidatus Poriferisodalis multihospitum]|uniref:amidohydrolase family protein n=1 Tax=Candidatus Poriferisodalis multihospitum TaxID=2983191 RepID=UPI00238D806F|nr:amidohydrolase family protein [Candidatus Poriferisodalis multihospitum]MDE0319715.1 amidohydrolase family protein [Acidimicrobiaceae bacterium]
MSTAPAQGYRDDHLHLLACAAARRSTDVQAAASVGELLDIVGHAARSSAVPTMLHGRQPSAERDRGDSRRWLRAWGYDDALLAERRHPTAAELDAVTHDVPTVLHHVTGHVAVVNTAAGNALGLTSGDVLVERHDLLAMVPRTDRDATVAGVAEVLADMAAAGITACTDATHTNDLGALELLAEAADMVPSVDVTAMVGADRLDALGDLAFGERLLSPGAAAGAAGVRVGHAKVMPPHDDGAIADLVAAARAHGFPVAVHVTDIDTLQATLDAVEAHPPMPAGTATSDDRRLGAGRLAPDRIEHCALALPEQLDRVARLGVAVVTQPSFVTRRAQKYREQLSLTEQAWLWPLASLLRRGIRVTLSSDAPTVPADPGEWIAAATGRDLAPAERIDADTARRLCMGGGADC